ncbi:hypothetical protein [Ilumatobacter sp.]|uniref:hypothetical protein n=1 Tax=Ilumatobacter sp. TaxID=1967498 RepID=UPI003C325ACF
MKVTVPLAALLLIAALGYILGTEHGRAQREVVMVRLGQRQVDDPARAGDENPA